MSESEPNRVRAVREARGLSQSELAAAASLSRQSVGAIEAGRATPAVDVALRLARALDCRVEELFALAAAEARIEAEPAEPVQAGRVALAHVGGRWVSYPLTGEAMRLAADAIVAEAPKRRGRVQVELVRPRTEAQDNLIVMGCAAALGVLADRLSGRAGAGRVLWLPRSSTQALAALAAQRTHVAGVHLVDGRTGEANVPDVRKHTPAAIVLITLARWEAGLLLAPGNPRKIRGAADLGRRGLRLVARETGSGSRRLLERELLRAGLSATLAEAAPVRASGHLEVAQAIASGAGEVGVATRDAAIAFGLEFVPLAEERYDLALPRALLADPRLVRFLEAMTSAAFRRELSSLGYDVRGCGDRVAELDAA
ncbi:transcriptional regulator of molybdate metabolism, XRE family [Nannocystis exedens]|uniref:Transcriptional regulator of molybdate metabolism, XRE family n=1 Tax=Nannocystis exedens TaxID=54 RepID=A0A1I2EFC8_9BACT|nr:substrate-binding domain-containing protein [Nannocystis exedens]PCC74758.1 regulator of molybdate uptake [Nannocystis exedens]SFE91383.1 transcriptional regulator of molybdate metabolism, XRE family [Nannocystis exedens]